MSYDWLRLENLCHGLQPPGRHCILTVSGTSANEFQGFPADLARMIGDEQWFWKPCPYPAMTFPMDKSVDTGVENLVALVNSWQGKFVLCGYSQGAIVVCRIWRDEILNPNGRLHSRFKDVIAIITYGDPMRAKGIARGNVIAGEPVPGGGGIAGDGTGRIDRVLTADETPSYLLSFAHEGDIYANTPLGTNVGRDMTAIFDIVMMSSGVMSFASIFKIAMGALVSPLAALPGVVGAIIHGLKFASGAVPTEPHVNYVVAPAASWLLARGQQISPTVD